MKILDEMTIDELKNELHTARALLHQRLGFFSFIDRVFRWRIIGFSICNPFYNTATADEIKDKKDAKLYYKTWTNKNYFDFEEILDMVVGTMQKNCYAKVRRNACGFIIKTAKGKYEIVVKEFEK